MHRCSASINLERRRPYCRGPFPLFVFRHSCSIRITFYDEIMTRRRMVEKVTGFEDSVSPIVSRIGKYLSPAETNASNIYILLKNVPLFFMTRKGKNIIIRSCERLCRHGEIKSRHLRDLIKSTRPGREMFTRLFRDFIESLFNNCASR